MSSSTLPLANSTDSGRMGPDEVTPPGAPATGTTVVQTPLQLSDAEPRCVMPSEGSQKRSTLFRRPCRVNSVRTPSMSRESV
jgi:hypothetical protein